MKIVKPVFMFLVVLIPTSVLAQAQSERQGWGYGFVAFGGTAPNGSIVTLTYGAGGERLVYRDLAVGAELASISPIESPGSGLGIFSANASYNFGGKDSSRKLTPFVTGGYSLAFRDGTQSGVNVGAGLQFWPSKHFAFRAEFRDHHFVEYGYNFYGVRLGVTFR